MDDGYHPGRTVGFGEKTQGRDYFFWVGLPSR
jgi:hypothetical protein